MEDNDTMTMSFEDLRISPHLCNTLRSFGYVSPSPVQAQCIPIGLSGNSVIAQVHMFHCIFLLFLSFTLFICALTIPGEVGYGKNYLFYHSCPGTSEYRPR